MIPSKVKIQAVGLSHIGLVRQNNEDFWAQIPDLHFYVLADGMGGHLAGEVAAKEAVENLCKLVKKAITHRKTKSFQEACSSVERAIILVNSLIFRMSRQNSELRGMGTTLCCLLIHSKGCIIAHVGDSRIYRVREGQIELMTKDHSLLRELMDLGQISEQNTEEFMYKNILTKAIGTEPNVQPDVIGVDIYPSDVYLLCSDGLSDMLTPKEIETVVNNSSGTKDTVNNLIQLANQKGGLDNVTVVMVKIEEAYAADLSG